MAGDAHQLLQRLQLRVSLAEEVFLIFALSEGDQSALFVALLERFPRNFLLSSEDQFNLRGGGRVSLVLRE